MRISTNALIAIYFIVSSAHLIAQNKNFEAQVKAKANAEEKDEQYQSISKEELKKKAPKPSKSLIEQSESYLVKHLNAMGQSTALADKINGQSQQNLNKYDDVLYWSALKDKPSQKADRTHIQKSMQRESSKVAAKNIGDSFKFWQELQKGVDFNLNLSSMWNSKSNETASTKTANKTRYGLILKDIKPNADRRYDQAANGSSVQYAGIPKANLIWTIGPVPTYEEGNLSAPTNGVKDSVAQASEVGPTAETGTTLTQSQPVSGDPLETRRKQNQLHKSIWREGPTARLKGNVKPSGNADSQYDNLASGKGGIPPLLTTLGQQEDLYTMTFETTPTLGRNTKTTKHRLMLPLFGNLNVGRTYNYDLKLESTHANNLLIVDSAPIVDWIYFHQKQQSITSSHIRVRKCDFSFSARTEAKTKTGTDDDERYDVGVSRSF